MKKLKKFFFGTSMRFSITSVVLAVFITAIFPVVPGIWIFIQEGVTLLLVMLLILGIDEFIKAVLGDK